MECAAYLTGFYRRFKDDVPTIVLMLISLFPFCNQKLGLAISAPTQCDQIIETEQNVECLCIVHSLPKYRRRG